MGKSKKLKDLPVDSDSEDETNDETSGLDVLNNVLGMKDKNPSEYNSIKHVLYATAIFFVLSLPFFDRIIELVLPITSSWLILLAVKTVVFFIGFYLLNKLTN